MQEEMISSNSAPSSRARTVAESRTAGNREPPVSTIYIVAILTVWAAGLILALYIKPDYDEFSDAELIYYSVYNVAVGAFVGLRLFGQLSQDRVGLTLLTAFLLIVGGTLVNEMLVEPTLFGDGPMNRDGFYYGITDVLITSAIFILIRLGTSVRALQRHAARFEGSGADIRRESWLLVKVTGGTCRVFAEDILYLEAERDFTRIICDQGEHFASESLKSLAEKSRPFGIVRVHKSFAVNVARVDRIARGQAHVGDFRIPIGRRYAGMLLASWSGVGDRGPIHLNGGGEEVQTNEGKRA